MRIELGNNRWQRVARQAVNRARYFFTNVLRRALDVAFQNESAGNIRETFKRIHLNFVDSADGGDSIFERQHDSGHHFFGSRARQPDLDVYRGRVSFRKEVNGQVAVGERS